MTERNSSGRKRRNSCADGEVWSDLLVKRENTLDKAGVVRDSALIRTYGRRHGSFLGSSEDMGIVHEHSIEWNSFKRHKILLLCLVVLFIPLIRLVGYLEMRLNLPSAVIGSFLCRLDSVHLLGGRAIRSLAMPELWEVVPRDVSTPPRTLCSLWGASLILLGQAGGSGRTDFRHPPNRTAWPREGNSTSPVCSLIGTYQ